MIKTHCEQEHELTPDNTYIYPSGYRQCRTCRREYVNNLLFGGNREKAIQRDSEKCVKCGMTRLEHKERFNIDITVDHKDGKGSKSKVKNNKLDNLQTLCLICHASKDNKARKLSDLDVINIRHMAGSLSQGKISKLYGVMQSHIHEIHTGTWFKHLLPKEG